MVSMTFGKTAYLALCMVLVLTGTAFASEIIIKDIQFEGLKRTKDHIALLIVRPVEIGDPFTDETEETIIQELREAGIFNPEIEVTTEIIDNEATINVVLRDRWTLIPVPLFSFSNSGSWRVGLLAIEGNFLGYYKTLGLGFFYGSEGWSLISFYNDQIFLGTDMKFTAGFGAGFNEVTDENVYEEVLQKYLSDDLGFSLALEYPFTEKFSLAGDLGYNRSILREESALLTGIPDLNTFGVGGEIKWKNIYYDIPYEKGFLSKASYGWNWGFDETENFSTIEGNIVWSVTPWWKHLIVLEALGGWGDLPAQAEFRLGGFPGSRILPSNKIAADQYVTSAFTYNVPVWFFPGGTLSTKVFYEAGYYSSDLVNPTLFHGPGLGLDIFINNLAIPAVQFNFGWNLDTGLFQFSAGVGSGGGGGGRN